LPSEVYHAKANTKLKTYEYEKSKDMQVISESSPEGIPAINGGRICGKVRFKPEMTDWNSHR